MADLVKHVLRQPLIVNSFSSSAIILAKHKDQHYNGVHFTKLDELYRLGKLVWVSKQNVTHLVSNMTRFHLSNCLDTIDGFQKKSTATKVMYELLLREFHSR